MTARTGFLHLNDGAWTGFVRHQVAIDDQVMRLMHAANVFGTFGFFTSPAVSAVEGAPWFRVRVDADPLPAGTHVQLFTYTADAGAPPVNPPSDPFAGWQALPRDVLDVLVPGSEAVPPPRLLWVGGLLRGDGGDTPRLCQIRVEYGREALLEQLPAIYAENDDARTFLERFLALPRSVLAGIDQEITDLPRLYDPAAAPDGGFGSWLAWLAGWLALDLNDRWSEAEARRAVAGAFALYGVRGTIEGLRRYLRLYAGVEAHIDEPVRTSVPWSLGAVSCLGFTTRLAPGERQGAVLDTSATLDRSYLTDEDCGGALFDDVAHRFCVRIHCGELRRPGALADARAVLDRERPAQTTYHLCVIEPRLRAGRQATVGIDTVVGGAPSPRLDAVLTDTVLDRGNRPCGGMKGRTYAHA